MVGGTEYSIKAQSSPGNGLWFSVFFPRRVFWTILKFSTVITFYGRPLLCHHVQRVNNTFLHSVWYQAFLSIKGNTQLQIDSLAARTAAARLFLLYIEQVLSTFWYQKADDFLTHKRVNFLLHHSIVGIFFPFACCFHSCHSWSGFSAFQSNLLPSVALLPSNFVYN